MDGNGMSLMGFMDRLDRVHPQDHVLMRAMITRTYHDLVMQINLQSRTLHDMKPRGEDLFCSKIVWQVRRTYLTRTYLMRTYLMIMVKTLCPWQEPSPVSRGVYRKHR